MLRQAKNRTYLILFIRLVDCKIIYYDFKCVVLLNRFALEMLKKEGNQRRFGGFLIITRLEDLGHFRICFYLHINNIGLFSPVSL
jgi:hypothetical protein